MLHGISALFLRLSSFDLSHKIIGITDDGIRSIADLKEYQPVGWTETELDALRRLVRANACTLRHLGGQIFRLSARTSTGRPRRESWKPPPGHEKMRSPPLSATSTPTRHGDHETFAGRLGARRRR